jgi:hypothetical protein
VGGVPSCSAAHTPFLEHGVEDGLACYALSPCMSPAGGHVSGCPGRTARWVAANVTASGELGGHAARLYRRYTVLRSLRTLPAGRFFRFWCAELCARAIVRAVLLGGRRAASHGVDHGDGGVMSNGAETLLSAGAVHVYCSGVGLKWLWIWFVAAVLEWCGFGGVRAEQPYMISCNRYALCRWFRLAGAQTVMGESARPVSRSPAADG